MFQVRHNLAATTPPSLLLSKLNDTEIDQATQFAANSSRRTHPTTGYPSDPGGGDGLRSAARSSRTILPCRS